MSRGGCGAALLACIGERSGRSKWIGVWRGCGYCDRCDRRAQRPTKRVQCERSERARAVFGTPAAIGRAEQRSGDRIRAGACLSEASLRPTPGGASSARHPAGARPLARLSFAYFSLAKQRKVRWPTGRNRYLKTDLTFAHLCFSETKKSKAHRRHLAANRQKPSFTAHKW